MYVIDGIYLTKRITGIQRYAIEITKELDKIVEKDSIQLLVPEYYEGDSSLENIRIIKYGNKTGRLWEQVDLVKYLKNNDAQGIFFENTIPVTYRKGIVVVHDISLKVNPNLFNKNLNDICSILWRRYLYRLIFKSSMKIVTVSEFSKSEIIKYYHVDDDRITVINNAWQHMLCVDYDETIIERADLAEGQYYFSLATMAPNKNFKWIVCAAKNNPEECFVIAGGGKIKQVVDEEYKSLRNLKCLGYVTDEEAKSLMKNCKAFIFPTLYEGFGIPPLEALVSGAPAIIVSNIQVMHEIYGDVAEYVEPLCYEVKTLHFECESSEAIAGFLNKYSWTDSARKLKGLII